MLDSSCSDAEQLTQLTAALEHERLLLMMRLA
jgi:hypothetical protein